MPSRLRTREGATRVAPSAAAPGRDTDYTCGDTSKKGITISTFNAVPDPIATFDLGLREGPHSALAAHGNLCKTKLNMPTAIAGQNGVVIKPPTRVAVAGCPKHKKATRAKTHKSSRRATR